MCPRDSARVWTLGPYPRAGSDRVWTLGPYAVA